jgi:hypothetical protein
MYLQLHNAKLHLARIFIPITERLLGSAVRHFARGRVRGSKYLVLSFRLLRKTCQLDVGCNALDLGIKNGFRKKFQEKISCKI